MQLETFLAAARDRTGLRDLGTEFDAEPFERLTSSVRREAKLTALGEMAFAEIVVHALANRLEIEDWYRRHPEIDEQEIIAPLFGVGLPRTGSTLLGHLLALDPATRSLRMWEAEKPCPPPIAGDRGDPRIEAATTRRLQSYALAPELASMVPFNGGDDPVECYELFFLTGLYHSYDCFVHCPSFTEWIYDPARDFTPAYRYHKRTLKLLQWRNPPRRWSLKMPNHSLTLEALNAVYPDARFVMTHRDPVKVIASTAHLNVCSRRPLNADPMPIFFGRQTVQHWADAMRRLLAFRAAHADRFFDIHHGDQLADSVGQMRRLYAWLGWPLTEDYLAAVAGWRSHNPQRPNPLDMADYGLDADEVRQAFAFYEDFLAAA